MSQTLPRRGIEDSMYPKPEMPKPIDWKALFGVDLGAMFSSVLGPFPSVGPMSRRTVTVLIEFDPDDISAENVTKEVLERLKDGHGRPWRGVRSHLWDSNVGWEVPGA